jgi:hypothetical protein
VNIHGHSVGFFHRLEHPYDEQRLMSLVPCVRSCCSASFTRSFRTIDPSIERSSLQSQDEHLQNPWAVDLHIDTLRTVFWIDSQVPFALATRNRSAQQRPYVIGTCSLVLFKVQSTCLCPLSFNVAWTSSRASALAITSVSLLATDLSSVNVVCNTKDLLLGVYTR